MVEEGIGDRDRLVEQAAGIVAQVEDEAGERVFRLARQLLDGILDARRRLLVEGGDPQVGDGFGEVQEIFIPDDRVKSGRRPNLIVTIPGEETDLYSWRSHV